MLLLRIVKVGCTELELHGEESWICSSQIYKL